jgi:predicted transcriptional regulator
MRDQLLARAAEAEAAIVALLKEEPRRHTEIIEAPDAPQSTTQARLKRLSDKGAIARSDDGLWSAV